MNRLRELRVKKGLTLAQTSKQLENSQQLQLTPDSLSKYERGDREPKLDTWKKLANFFDVSVGYLQGLDKYVIDTSHYFALFSYQLKKAKSSAKPEQLLKYQNLHDLDAMEAAGWKYETFLNDNQIDTLLDTISNVYNSWLAYDNQKHRKDPKIDEFFSSFEVLTRELYFASLGLYMNADESEYDTNFQDLISTITPAISSLKQINKKISQRKSNQ